MQAVVPKDGTCRNSRCNLKSLRRLMCNMTIKIMTEPTFDLCVEDLECSRTHTRVCFTDDSHTAAAAASSNTQMDPCPAPFRPAPDQTGQSNLPSSSLPLERLESTSP